MPVERQSAMEDIAGAPVADILETTRDAFLGGTVMIRQPRQGYRAGLDAVLLAASVPASDPDRDLRLLDVGAGVGVVGLCAAARLPGAKVTLVEKSAPLCALAAANIAENNLDDRARVIQQDIANPEPAAPASKNEPGDNGFDVVVSNPPFYDATRHRPSPHTLKATAHAMPETGLDGWVRYMARMTRANGTAIMIHRVDHLPAMLTAFQRRFGGLTVLPLHPRAGQPASRAILHGIKGSRAPLSLLPGIALHGSDDRFVPEIDKILKTPAPLNKYGAVRATV